MLLASAVVLCASQVQAQVPTVSVADISFTDQDFDASELGGPITWTEPGDTSQVLEYQVYLADDAAGTNEAQIGGNVAVGTNELLMPADTAAKTHILVYTANSNGRQVNPASASAVDVVKAVSGVSFTDLDLDGGDLGGTLSWTEPASTADVNGYSAYFATAPDGTGRYSLGALVASGSSSITVTENTALSSYTHAVVYIQSVLEEQDTPEPLLLVDTDASVTNLAFTDLDLDTLELGGTMSWDAPTDSANVVLYYPMIAASSAGASRSLVGSAPLAVTTTSATFPVDSAISSSYTHVVVYTASAAYQATTPTAISLVDGMGDVGGLTFDDKDLDASELGGTITWTAPTHEARVSHYAAFFSPGTDGTSRSQVGVTVDVGTHAVPVAPETLKSSYVYVLVYSKSNLDWMTTPVSLAIQDSNSIVQFLAFEDLDLDHDQVGGSVSWSTPADAAHVTTYAVFLAEDVTGTGKSQVGNTLGYNVLTAAVAPETTPGSFTHVVVYTGSSLVEQTTPAHASINDHVATASPINFGDRDLDAGDVGGLFVWSPPMDTSRVDAYAVYLAEDSTGSRRASFGIEVPVGTNLLQVPADTASDGLSHLVIYTKSSLVEQTTPGAIAINDLEKVVSAFFVDRDLDSNEIGGTIYWHPPPYPAVVKYYVVYLGEDAVGAGKSRVGSSIDAGIGDYDADLPPNTSVASFTHILVYTQSSFVESTTPAAAAILDHDASPTSVIAEDDDLDAGQIGSLVRWVPASGSVSDVITYYRIYLVENAAGANRSLVGAQVGVGTNQHVIPVDTALDSFTHVAIYARSSLYEQTTPTSVGFADGESRVSAITLEDDDLDFGHLGGTVSWTLPPSPNQVTAFMVYLSDGSDGYRRSQTGNAVAANANTDSILPDAAARNFVIVYASSVLAEQTTPAYASVNDSDGRVSSMVFADEDLDAGEFGGDVTWVLAPDDSRVLSYNVYLAQSSNPGAERSQVGSVGSGVTTASFLEAAAGTFRWIIVLSQSSLAEQTTPTGIVVVDVAASVHGIAFADLDLDLGQLGGTLSWQPPSSTTQVVGYTLYLAESAAGSRRSPVGFGVAVGTNEAAVAVNTAMASYNTIVVYTNSSKVEQTTPAATSVADYSTSVVGLAFEDLDLDSGEIGGTVTWSSVPDPFSRIQQLKVELAQDAMGAGRSLLGAHSPGVFTQAVSAELPIASWSHVVVFAQSVLAEQSTPSSASISDVAVLATTLSFVDADLDAGQFGGPIGFRAPAHAAPAVAYKVYVAADSAGTSRSLVGSVVAHPGGTGTISTADDLIFAIYDYVVVYAQSSLVEQTTPAYVAIADEDASVSNVAFTDDDLDADELGGYFTWTAPASVHMVVGYNAYLAQAADGTTRSGLVGGATVQVGTNTVLLPAETAEGFVPTYAAVYTKSYLAEQTTPDSVAIVDNHAQVSGLTFPDLDLDANDMGGIVSWTPVDTSRIFRYVIYLCEDADGADPVPATEDFAYRVELGTNTLVIPANTPFTPPPTGVIPHGIRTHLVVFCASILAEQTTAAAAAALLDVARSVSNLTFIDSDLDVEEIGGTLEWTPPSPTTEVAQYVVYMSIGAVSPVRVSVGQVAVGTNIHTVPYDSSVGTTTHIAIFTKSTFTEQSTPTAALFSDASASVTGVFFSDVDFDDGEIEGMASWNPPATDESLVNVYAVYLAADAAGTGRTFAFASPSQVPVGTNEASIPAATSLASESHLLVYTMSTLNEQTTPTALKIADLFQGRDLLHVGLDADTTSNTDKATIETFTFVGCYQSAGDASAFGTVGTNALLSTISTNMPEACADACAQYEVFAVHQDQCVCARPKWMTASGLTLLANDVCEAACDTWSTATFPTLADYFASLPGFCGSSAAGAGTSTPVGWSIYEQYDAIVAVGQGVADRTRDLWWQAVLVQSFTAGGADSESSEYYEASHWQWHMHASSLTTGRAAFPLHRKVDQPIVGLVIEEHTDNPRVIGTTARGDVIAVSVGARPAQRIMNASSYPGHTVEGTAVEPGGAPILAYDASRGVLFATQPAGDDTAQLYALALSAGDDSEYLYIRFVPTCGTPWCSINEIRLRYHGTEIDLSTANTSFYDDLSDTSLQRGAMLIHFASPVMVDEFSVSVPYNVTPGDYLTWVLEGTNDIVRRCVLEGAPSIQSMPNGTYTQFNGEHRQGRPVYRATTGEIIYWDDDSVSWWVSPKIRNRGYGAIRCIGDYFEPHLLSGTSCSVWNGHRWVSGYIITFNCTGNEWDVLHRQDDPYSLPTLPASPLPWFKASRNLVSWTAEGSIDGHVGLLVADPVDGYVAGTITKDGTTSLHTLGQVTDATCSFTTGVTWSASSTSAVATTCAATTFARGDWVYPDTSGALTMWFMCATSAELSADESQSLLRYVEATTDGSFGWGTGTLTQGRADYATKAQAVRILEKSLQPSLPAGAFVDGLRNNFLCSVQNSTCLTDTILNVRLINGDETCGCAAEVAQIDPHGFYKVCYCVSDAPRYDTQSVACDQDEHFNLLAGTAIGMGPEPARQTDLDLILGQSWAYGISDTTATFSGIYKSQLEYAAGTLFGGLSFPSVVSLTTAPPSSCGPSVSECGIVGPVVCTLGEPCLVKLDGTAMQTYNGLKVVYNTSDCVSPLAYPDLATFENLINPRPNSTFGTSTKVGHRSPMVWDLGTPTRGSLDSVNTSEPGPGVYKLCWALNPSAGHTTEEQAYYLDAGVVSVIGPFVMDFECSLQFSCEISISGIGLASTNKVLLLESAAGRCGMANVPLLDSQWLSITNPAPVQLGSTGEYNKYVFGIAAGKSGATHRLCWAHDPVNAWDLSSVYSVEIDADFLWARFTAVVDCVGRSCTITIYGVGVTATSQLLLIEQQSSCGDASATALSLPGLTNPQLVVDPGVVSSTVGVYVMSTTTVSLPFGYHICWAADPAGPSADNFPLEVLYPQVGEPAVFFPDRVGSISVVRLETNHLGHHRALAVYADPEQLPALGSGHLDPRLAYDCCGNSGYAAAAIIDVVGTTVRPSIGLVFQNKPSNDFVAAAISVREAGAQGLQCGTPCGREFTSTPQEFVFAAGFLDVSRPQQATGTVMLLKAQPAGLFESRTQTWHALRAQLYKEGHLPPVYEATRCATEDTLATCTSVSRAVTDSMRLVALSETRLLATFIDGPAQVGTAVVIRVVHHLPDAWEFQTGLKIIFNTNKTSNCDVVAMDSSTAIVSFADEDSRQVQALVLQVNGDETTTDNVTVGPVVDIGVGNLTQELPDWYSNGSVWNATNYTNYTRHGRVSICKIGSSQALVAFGPIGSVGELALLTVSGTNVVKSVSQQFLSSNMDAISLVGFSDSGKALAVYRDEADGGMGKVQEVDVYGDFNGFSYSLRRGSLNTLTSFRAESLAATRLDSSAALVAYRAMDGTAHGHAAVIRTG